MWGAPNQLVALQLYVVGTVGDGGLDQSNGFARDGGIADGNGDFAVLQLRSQVEVHRADHQQALVHHHDFRMQAGARAARRAALGASARCRRAKVSEGALLLGVHFINFYTDFQQGLAVARVADVGGRGVVGGQRVGQHAHANAAFSDLGKLFHHAFAGHEVGRDDQDIVFGLGHQLQQAVHCGVLGFFSGVGVGGNLGGLVDQQHGGCPGPGQGAQIGRVRQHRQAAGRVVGRARDGGDGGFDASELGWLITAARTAGVACSGGLGLDSLNFFGRHQRLHRVGQRIVPVLVKAA